MHPTINYCSNCGSKVTFGPVPEENRPRHFCSSCQTIHYQNPRIIVGCLPRWQEQVLLCRRAIEPRAGLWTLPAGFMEMDETAESGAARETLEEANAEVQITRLFSVYSLPRVGQVYLIFLAELSNLNFSPGAESLEVKLFSKKEIPWKDMAFSAITFTLEHYVNSGSTGAAVALGAREPSRPFWK